MLKRLVITIIVMLILAGVSLNAIIGDNGIISSAQNAKEKSIIEEDKEKIKVLYVEALAKEEDLYKTFEKSIKKEFGNDTVVTDMLDGSFGIEKNSDRKMKYVIDEDGKVENDTYQVWNGTAIEPTNKTSTEIHIYTAEEFKWLANQVNDNGITFEGYTIYLENDLDLGARQKDGELIKGNEWIPIGKDVTYRLNAQFEGQNHVIKGVYVNYLEADNVGLFGWARIIKNLTIKDSYVFGGRLVGGIVGRCGTGGTELGLLENCHNVRTTVQGKDMYCGGLIGISEYSKVKGCTNSGEVLAKRLIGGIIGFGQGGVVVENCINYGKIASETYGAGGIGGYLYCWTDMRSDLVV